MKKKKLRLNKETLRNLQSESPLLDLHIPRGAEPVSPHPTMVANTCTCDNSGCRNLCYPYY